MEFSALPVSLIDLYPTLIDLCDLPSNTMKNEKGRPLDGHSPKPLLTQPASDQWTGPKTALTALYKWANHYDPAKQSYSLRAKNGATSATAMVKRNSIRLSKIPTSGRISSTILPIVPN